MKILIFSFLTFISITVFAEQTPVQSPKCTITKCAEASATQDCNGDITTITVTRCATVTDNDCGTASTTAMILATINAQRDLRKFVDLLPPCTGPGDPHNE